MQGDVVAIYNTAGTVQAKYKYDAFGNCTVTNSTNLHLATYNPIRYRGYYYDDETKWYFLNARYYSPEWRRFISPDNTAYLHLGNTNGLNLYCYCGNDSINFVDPSGHDWNSFWNSVWNFIVAWYEQVINVNQQTAITNNGVIIEQNQILSNTIMTIAKLNMSAQGLTAESERAVNRQVGDWVDNQSIALIYKTGKFFEKVVPIIFPNPSSEDVKKISAGLVGAAGSPHIYDISSLYPDIVNVSWE